MNERIKQLVKEANLTEIIDDSYLERGDWTPTVEKLAELIVKECAEVAARVVVEHEGVEFGLVEACYQHFGVEE